MDLKLLSNQLNELFYDLNHIKKTLGIVNLGPCDTCSLPCYNNKNNYRRDSCEVCDIILCPDCIYKCSDCKKRVCVNHVHQCDVCGSRYCLDCLHQCDCGLICPDELTLNGLLIDDA